MVQKHKLLSNIISYTAMVLVSVIFIYPLFFLLANSLRPYISKTPVLFFTESHFENYYFAVAMIPFTKYLLNTMKMVVMQTKMQRLMLVREEPHFQAGAAPTDDPGHCHSDSPVRVL